MNFRKLAVAFAALGLVVGCSQGDPYGFVGKPAPEFKVSPLKPSGDVSLADFKGKVVLLDFWATWCGPCKMLMPKLSALQTKYAAKGLVVLGITNDPRPVVQALHDQVPLSYDFFLDTTGDISKTWKAFELPVTAIIGRDGKVVFYDHGYSDSTPEILDKTIADALSG